jgi:hypothetical protein
VVTVQRDVDVPAFTESGQRDVANLKAGSTFQEVRPFDAHHLICASRFGTHGVFYVVPRDVVTVTADEEESAEEEDYFPSREEYNVAVSAPSETGTPPIAVSPPLELSRQQMRDTFRYKRPTTGKPTGPRGPYGYVSMDSSDRFMYTRTPILVSPKDGKVLKIEMGFSPDKLPRDLQEKLETERALPDAIPGRYDAYHVRAIKGPQDLSIQKPRLTQEDPASMQQQQKSRYDTKYFFYKFLPTLHDRKTGENIEVQDQVDAQKKMDQILRQEEEMIGPEETEHATVSVFKIRRVQDPSGQFAFEIFVPGSPALSEQFKTRQEAEAHIEEGNNMELLLEKAAPYLT